MSNKANMCILFRDETVDMVFIDHTVLGAQIKFSERLPRDESVFETIAERMRSVEKMPSRVRLCLPRGSVMQRTLRYPAMVQNEIGNMIQFEATRHVPLPESDRALAYSSVLTPDESQVTLNLTAARQSDIRALVGQFEAVGVPVDEVVPFSALVTPVLGGSPSMLVVADVRNIELCLYGEGQLQDSQLIRCDAPGFSPERVVTSARQMVAKHKDWLGDEGIGHIWLTGGDKQSELFEADLGTAFGLHVHPLAAPGNLISTNPALADVLLASSIELSPSLNLVENPNRKVPISRRTTLISALCAILMIELVAGFAFKIGAPKHQRRQVAEEISRLRRRTAPIQHLRDKNRELRRQLYRLDEITRSHVSMMEVLRALSEALPEDTYLRTVSFKNGEGMRIKGLSKDPEKLPGVIMAIPMVESISTSDIDKKVDDYHEFTISVTLRSPDNEEA